MSNNKTEATRFGVWRRFLYPNGAYFTELKCHATFFGLPLLHYTRGICPETGRRVIARGGVVAVGSQVRFMILDLNPHIR